MKIHCANNWLFHNWKDGKCTRCRIPIGRSLGVSTSADDPSLFGVPVPDPLADPASRRDSVVRPLLRLVRGSPDEDDSSSETAAGNPVS